MRILALDVGADDVTAAILDAASATIVGPVGCCNVALDHPTPEAAEVPADRLWSAITTAARSATRGVDGVEAVGLSCSTPALVLLDAADRPLAPIWTHLDRRSRPAARQTWAGVGDEFLASTGNRPLPGGTTVIMYRQMLVNEPYLHRKTTSYLHVNGWLGLRMAGAKAMDPANASCTGLFGTMTDQKWSQRWCDHFDVDPAWLPPVVCGSTTLGPLRPAVAAELGVPAGVPVKLGTADMSSAMLAAGLGPGDVLHMVGTTQLVAAFTDKPRPDTKRLTRPLGVGQAFIHVAHNPIGAVALDWLRELCFRDQAVQEFFEQTVPAALERPTRVTLDPAFLGRDHLEIEAHRAAFRDLTLSTDRLDLLAALMEAMRRMHRQALAALDLGGPIRRVYLTGAGALTVRGLFPEYQTAAVQVVDAGCLRGVARLFHPG